MTMMFRKKIRFYRKQKGLTLRELADKVGSGNSKGYICDLENGVIKKPSADKVLRLAKVLGVTVEFLMDDDQDEPSISQRHEVFYSKFRKLSEKDQETVMEIVEMWSKKNLHQV